MRSSSDEDFGQYYAGGLVARHGLWSSLYPIPNAALYNKPPDFRPYLPNMCFDPKNPKERQGKWSFYPQIASLEGSNIAPELIKICPELQANWRYIYPPPLAVLLWPLGFFSYHTAREIWFSVMCASYFGMAFFASRICRVLWNRVSYAEGCVVLLPLLPICLASNMSTTLSIGNASPLIGFLISGVGYAWIRNIQAGVGIGIIPLILFKGIGLNWCPLFLISPKKWKTIVVMAFLTILLNGMVIYLGGADLYGRFFTEILPKANVPRGIGLQGLLMAFLGIELKIGFSILNLILLGTIYLGYWRNRGVADHTEYAAVVASAIAGSMAAYCLLNPVVWPHHYYVNYLLLPFSAWLLWEYFQANGLWKKWVFVMVSLNFLFFMDSLVLLKNSLLMEWFQSKGIYGESIAHVRTALNGFVVYLLSPSEFVFMLLLSYKRLYFGASVPKRTINSEIGEQDLSHLPNKGAIVRL
jgi:hypothetical protein